ncbi:MAG: FIST C-terminal domain-containing protein [Saprospiraceae bacterium]|nr:FIST C-terminal domain-containing protein [Saprospiraceae bacterium]
MKTFQRSLSNLDEIHSIELNFRPNLLLCFVSPQFKEIDDALSLLKDKFPEAMIAGCSTSGEILDVSVYDQSIALTAIEFEKTEIRLITEDIEDPEHSHQAGLSIAKKLSGDKLKHIMIFSDGLHVNGAELVRGLRSGVSDKTSVTGGLAGDGSDFAHTFVISNGNISEKKIIGIGFYSDDLKIGCGSKGGWDSFGLERRVTKARSNVLYEIDGQPALALYKTYLGDKAAELPSSGLLFPLSMRDQERELPVVRTILAVNEEDQSLTFAGDIPEGSYVRLMKANINRIIDGAQASAQLCNGKGAGSSLAVLISCVGRRLVLKQLVEEEIEAVRGVLGEQPSITGFYSYGEIAPFEGFSPCQLHNQTMTITTFSE